MNEIERIDERIEQLNIWIHKSASALRTFYRPDLGVFWRDNTWAQEEEELKKSDPKIKDPKRKHKHSPTSTARSFFAICEYTRFLYEEYLDPLDPKAKFKKEFDSSLEILKGVSSKYFATLVEDLNQTVSSDTNQRNPFTDSHILIAVSSLPYFKPLLPAGIDIAAITTASIPLAEHIKEVLEETSAGVKPDPSKFAVVHDFLTLHSIRGLDAFRQVKLKAEKELELQRHVKQRVLRLLAYDFARVTSKFDASELAFSIALLNRFKAENVEQLTSRALHSIADAQQGGVWPAGSIISYGTKSSFYVASFEVALTLTHILIRELTKGEFSNCEKILNVLDSTFDFARNSYSKRGSYEGWANDHARAADLIESWVTSIVVQFLIQYRQANLYMRQCIVLKKYNAQQFISRSEQEWQSTFPDLAPQHRLPDWIDKLDAITDPTPKNELQDILEKQFLKQVRVDIVHRPRRVASMILYGNPGAGKTSLIKSMAKALGWPLVTISPPVFLKEGIEGFESTAASIFSDLMKLRRCVVLFDECEDLFRFRPANPTVESRTEGAFITAGMLPRLQELRDNSWIMFVLATNSALNDLDKAVIRPGRFDFAYEVPFPSLEAALRFTSVILSANTDGSELKKQEKRVKDTLEQYFQREQHSGCEGLSFATLKSFVRNLADFPDKSTEELLKDLGKLQSGPQSLLG